MASPVMSPAPGSTQVRFVGDRLRVRIDGGGPGWQARLRTTLGRGAAADAEIIASLRTPTGVRDPFAGRAWRDIPLRRTGDGWDIDLPITETGWFRAKTFLIDPDGHQHWPDGGDLGIAVHPDWARCGNTVYCAFARMFGPDMARAATRTPALDDQVSALDRHGWTVIPPSGTLRGLARQLPHIVDRLGCRILHLLPVMPTPTTYAKFGRFGSPYAAQDLTAVDPALAEFDKTTTPVDQFIELTGQAHARGARVFLDIVINHTGWGSTLQNRRPEWFQRNPDGTFRSPGAWGTVWEDLVELDHHHPDLWEVIADSLLTWCRRGVDGFRCDAGYMVPLPAWRYITARVRRAFPETVFLLEGLGGAWDLTEHLLTEGGMQWAYSELFQNHTPESMAGYLDHALAASRRCGVLIHYSETHDNQRLAARGKAWALLRNRVCALASTHGGFGFTAGVEWLASEKLEVHQARGMNWGADEHICDDLARLTRIVADHPCFLDGAEVVRIGAPADPVLVLARRHGPDRCLVLINSDLDAMRPALVPADLWEDLGRPSHDLLGTGPSARLRSDGRIELLVAPGAAHVLANHPRPVGLAGPAYRAARARAAFAYRCLAALHPIEDLGPAAWTDLAAMVDGDPLHVLAAISTLDRDAARTGLVPALHGDDGPAPVVRWSRADHRRIVPVPPGWWVLVEDDGPFTVTPHEGAFPDTRPLHAVPAAGRWIAAIPPARTIGDLTLHIDRAGGEHLAATLRRLTDQPIVPIGGRLALLTNGRGGMARLHADLGRIESKYDCLLGANLHPDAPSDRHVLAKRLRAWIDADGFITALDGGALTAFTAGDRAEWSFNAPAGDGRCVPVRLTAWMPPHRNALVLTLHRPDAPAPWGDPLPTGARVSVTLRLDLEDRSFHDQTVRSDESESRLSRVADFADREGFRFRPAPDRGLDAWIDHGRWHPEPEWSIAIPHPIEASRGMAPAGDARSPGWFSVPLAPGATAVLTLDADIAAPAPIPTAPPAPPAATALADHLARAARSYVVQRGRGLTVIAGYPWFLDWGRDTLICARGLLAAGMVTEVREILRTFARFAEGGTLPNLLNGDRAENRDTSDAPLWFCLAASELAARTGPAAWDTPVDHPAGTLLGVVESLCAGYRDGTPNGIHMDPASGLIWSPPHFTWMDTNYPACTPRTGYPIDIQALWWHAVHQLATLNRPGWADLAERIAASLDRFWLPDLGWCADCLVAPDGEPAAAARPDTALRPNQAFLIALGALRGDRARRAVDACLRHLVVPGAIRTLAPLPVDPPLVITSPDGHPLVDPRLPYQGHYEGDEDTRRKPAYHNGTAWPWVLPTLTEALATAWDHHPRAVAAARAHLAGMADLLAQGVAGHLPEIIDGDAPHTPRGCDAQAWSITECLRVWTALTPPAPPAPRPR